MTPDDQDRDQEQRGSDGRFVAGNSVRITSGHRSDRARRRRRQQFQAEAERDLRGDLPAPVPALLFRITATALADLYAFEDHLAKKGGPLKVTGSTLGLWDAYEGQKRLVIDLLERCGVAPARGRAARTAPQRAVAEKLDRAAQAQQRLMAKYGLKGIGAEAPGGRK